jgi:ABC-type polysaccharide/polyol phosphate transport system ATPase subunit
VSEFPQALGEAPSSSLQLESRVGFNPATSGNGNSSVPATTVAISLDSVDNQQSSVDDWSFLGGFGDATYEFYSMDVELRRLLDTQFSLNATKMIYQDFLIG